MLEPWEREAAISAILDRGLVPKPGIGPLLRTALNAQVLFFGVVDCIFLSILAAVVLMIPLLAAVLQQASPAPMLFLASPALYALLLGLLLAWDGASAWLAALPGAVFLVLAGAALALYLLELKRFCLGQRRGEAYAVS